MQINQTTVAEKLVSIVRRVCTHADTTVQTQDYEPWVILPVYPSGFEMASSKLLGWLGAEKSKPPMHFAISQVIQRLGWCKDTVWMGTFLWAIWYGRDMYMLKHGHYPVDMDKWLEACFTADNLEAVLEQEW